MYVYIHFTKQFNKYKRKLSIKICQELSKGKQKYYEWVEVTKECSVYCFSLWKWGKLYLFLLNCWLNNFEGSSTKNLLKISIGLTFKESARHLDLDLNLTYLWYDIKWMFLIKFLNRLRFETLMSWVIHISFRKLKNFTDFKVHLFITHVSVCLNKL